MAGVLGHVWSTIHNNRGLQQVEKFNYLRSQLTVSASELLFGLELTNANYDTAIQLMKDRYGKRQIMVDAHYSQMINMPAATVNRVSLRSFYDVTEKHLRSLQALGEITNQMQILSMMKPKLPRIILEDIEQMKDDEEEWTVKSFRKRLNKKINALEAANLQISLYKKTDEFTILTSSYRLAEDSSHYYSSHYYFVKEDIGMMSAEDILTLLLEKKKSKTVVIYLPTKESPSQRVQVTRTILCSLWRQRETSSKFVSNKI